MYAFIRGIVDEIETDSVVLDAGGIGYRVLTNTSALSQCRVGSEAKLYTCHIVRDDEMILVGFLTSAEKRQFERLQTVSGVGAKLALAVLSHFNVGQLALALATGDVASLCRVPGVGKKTAQRLVLELKERISQDELISTEGTSPAMAPGAAAEAVSALISLGFSSQEAAMAVEQVKSAGDSAEELIKAALRRAGA